jgi:hypothetical protein
MDLAMIISIILMSAIIICTILYVSGPSCKENYRRSIEKYYKNIKPADSSLQIFDKAGALDDQSRWNVARTVREQFSAENNSKIINMISHVLYINLPNRSDRDAQIKRELDTIGLSYTRIEGVVNKFGGLGCSMAHLKALQYAKRNNFNNVLICEDDMKLKYNREKLYNNLVQALTYLGNDYDVLMLTGGKVKSYSIPGQSFVRRVESAQTRTAYVVNSNYYDTLIANFADNVRELASRGPSCYSGNVSEQPLGKGFAGDQYWKHLQPGGRWFIMKRRLCKQRKSFSNIQNVITNYLDS